MGRAYINIPGSKTHELPPLLVRSVPEGTDLATVMDRAGDIVESEEMLSEMADVPETERRKYDLALNLTEQYLRLFYDVTGTAPTTGKILAGIVMARQSN